MIRVTVDVSCDLCAQWACVDRTEFVADPAPVARHTITVVLDRTPPKTWMVAHHEDELRPLHLRFCPDCIADVQVVNKDTHVRDDALTSAKLLDVYRRKHGVELTHA